MTGMGGWGNKREGREMGVMGAESGFSREREARWKFEGRWVIRDSKDTKAISIS